MTISRAPMAFHGITAGNALSAGSLVLIILLWCLAAPLHATVPISKACIANLRTMEGAMEMYDMDTQGSLIDRMGAGSHPFPFETLIEGKYIKSSMTCRSGGEYSLILKPAEDGKASLPEMIAECSYHGTVNNPKYEYAKDMERQRYALPKTIAKTILIPIILTFWILLRLKREHDLKACPPGTGLDIFVTFIAMVCGSWLLIGYKIIPVRDLGIGRGMNAFTIIAPLLMAVIFVFCLLALLSGRLHTATRKALKFHVTVTGIAGALMMVAVRSHAHGDYVLPLCAILIAVGQLGLIMLEHQALDEKMDKYSAMMKGAQNPGKDRIQPNEPPENLTAPWEP